MSNEGVDDGQYGFCEICNPVACSSTVACGAKSHIYVEKVWELLESIGNMDN